MDRSELLFPVPPTLASPFSVQVIKEAGENAVEPNAHVVPADHEIIRGGRRKFGVSEYVPPHTPPHTRV